MTLNKGLDFLLHTQPDLETQKVVVNLTRGGTINKYSDDWLKCHQNIGKAQQNGPLNSIHYLLNAIQIDSCLCFVSLGVCELGDNVCECSVWFYFIIFLLVD